MDWLNIFEKLADKINVNFFITAASITAFGWWYYSKQDILLAVSCCLAIYLLFVFVNHRYILFIENEYSRKREEEISKKKLEEERQIQQLIEIWFAALHKDVIDDLLQLLTWNAVPTAQNIKVHSSDKERIIFDLDSFVIPTGHHKEPIVVLSKVYDNFSNLNLTYFIHPYLMKLLEDYKSKT